MRVFVTGATGFIGSAVVKELMAAGHEVLGLARSDTAARALAEADADVHRGSLEDLDSLRRGVEKAEGVIHCGFIHDFSKFQENCDIDKRAIEAIGAALEGSDRPLLVTSALAVLAQGRVATEDDPPVPVSATYPRASEATAAALATRGLRAAVVRLPQVHGEGDHAFVPHLIIDIAREKGFAAYIGEGKNRWSAVHRLDAAKLYRLAFEQAVAGARYHAVAEKGIALRDIAKLIARRLDLPVKSLTGDAADDYFGGFRMFAGMDLPASSDKTRAALGWQPKEIGLLADLDQDYYFNS